MDASAPPARPGRLVPILGRRRLVFVLGLTLIFGLILSLPSQAPTYVVVGRAMLVGLCALLAFGVFERWPARLPGWLGRWVLQLAGVVFSVPLSTYLAYWLTTGGDPQLPGNALRLNGYLMMVVLGTLFSPWIALAAMLRQREAYAREQALAFELERSELERRALDARMRLLQAQVQPHFLFNTLANVQALVQTGAPQASRVLDSLIAYLRAAVPRLDQPATTLEQELQLVRAYLELMHMRMPDRLRFEVRADDAARHLRCPPLTLQTLVENAVRHGIDPSEDGGRIDVEVRVRDGRCALSVADTGVGLRRTGDGLGTGLASLRERLRLAFGGDANLRVSAREPHGVVAEVDFPAERIAA
jgi:two-component sensor histidine kinase